MSEALDAFQHWFDNSATPAISWCFDTFLADYYAAPAFTVVLLLAAIFCALLSRSASMLLFCLIFTVNAVVLHGIAPTQTLKNGLFTMATIGVLFLALALFQQRRKIGNLHQSLVDTLSKHEETKRLLELEIEWRRASE